MPQEHIICRDAKVRCLKRDAQDTEVEGVVARVYDDGRHVDIRYGFLGMLSREGVPIRFVEVME